MSDPTGEYVDPIEGRAAVSGLDGSRESPVHTTGQRIIRGRVVAVRRETARQQSGHILDVTVGGAEHTEIVVRTEDTVNTNLEGKTVTIVFSDG